MGLKQLVSLHGSTIGYILPAFCENIQALIKKEKHSACVYNKLIRLIRSGSLEV